MSSLISPPIRLLNCQRCDDIVKLIETERCCECGQTRGLLRGENIVVTTVQGNRGRVFELEWEDYDGTKWESKDAVSVAVARLRALAR